MKTSVSNSLCIFAIVCVFLLLSIGNIYGAMLGLLLFVGIIFHGKKYPNVWKNLYRSYMRFITNFLKD